MKIINVQAFPVKLQFKEPFTISNVINYDMFYVIVKITADNGLVGYGEAIPAWEVTGETQFGVMECIYYYCDQSKTGMSLIGKDISTFENVLKLLSLLSPKNSLQKIFGAHSAKTGIEQAILDVHGKYTQKPIYEMFGGVNSLIECSTGIGILSVEETLMQVTQAVNNNAKVIKLKVGIREFCGYKNYLRDIIVIKEARKIINSADPKIKLRADANQGFINAKQTIEFIKQVGNCLDCLEQPILSEDLFGFKQIKLATGIKLMADESVHGYESANNLLKIGGIDYINVKLMKTGGLVEALRIAELAQKYNVVCQMGSMLENCLGTSICAHAYLCHNNFKYAEIDSFSRLRSTIGKGISCDKHILSISSGFGNGININEHEIQENIVSLKDPLLIRRMHELNI